VSYLKLTDTTGQQVAESSGAALRFGRDPDASVVVRGEAARVASVRHAELRFEHGAWFLADLSQQERHISERQAREHADCGEAG